MVMMARRMTKFARQWEKGTDPTFVDRIAELSPQLVTFSGSSFGMPSHDTPRNPTQHRSARVIGPPDFNRYTDDSHRPLRRALFV
jgi:hypothetical protein